MKKQLLCLLLAAAGSMSAEIINLQGTDYDVRKLEERQIGPGTVYTRYRVPDFALNINVVTVDMNNPYIKIETSVANERSAGTELLTEAAKRYDAPNHHAIAAQNSNFWIVSSQPQWAAYGASTHGISLREGMLSIDSKSFPHWWWWTTRESGIVAVGTDNRLWIDLCNTEMDFTSEKTGTLEYHNCNKGFKPGQISIYTPFFGSDRQFLPLRADYDWETANNDIHYDVVEDAECTEVLLRLAEGESWRAGVPMTFTVAEVRHSNGRGTLGDYDLAIVSRRGALDALTAGDAVTLRYSWLFDPDGAAVRPEITNAVGGNMMVMRHGQITPQNEWDSYNTMVYSRSAYGSSEDGRKLFMLVIDKSMDPVWGGSAGCTTAVMCDFMRHLGAWNVINVDAGGSAELMVGDRIINRTTEGNPRPVGNGWMVFNTAPDDVASHEVGSLAFEDVEVRMPVMASYTPQIIAYDTYGSVISYDYRDFTVSCAAEAGSCEGDTYNGGSATGTYTITATAPNGVSVSKEVPLLAATPAMRMSHIVLDNRHPYTIEVLAEVEGKTYLYNPARMSWSTDDSAIAAVDDDGVLTAVANGATTLRGSMGELEFSATVSVENPSGDAVSLTDNYTAWSAKGNSGLKNMTLGADGTISFDYASPRGYAQITLARQMVLYGMPTALEVEFTSDLPVDKMEMNIVAAGQRKGSIAVTPAEPFAAAMRHKVTFDIATLAPLEHATYPLTFNNVRFDTKVGDYAGHHEMTVHGVTALYGDNSGIDAPAVGVAQQGTLAIYPNPVAPGAAFGIGAAESADVEIYSLTGALAATGTTAPEAPGTYIVRCGSRAALLIVR